MALLYATSALGTLHDVTLLTSLRLSDIAELAEVVFLDTFLALAFGALLSFAAFPAFSALSPLGTLVSGQGILLYRCND